MKKLKRRSILFGLILFILFSYTPVAFAEMAKGAKVGNVNVEGKTFDEAVQALETEIAIWADSEIVAEGEGASFILPTEVFTFDVNASLQELESKTKRSIKTFFLRPKNVSVPLHVSLNYTEDQVKGWPKHIDVEATFNQALETAKELGQGPVPVVVNEDLSEDLEKVSEVKLRSPDASETVIKMLVKELDGATIEEGKLFSFLDSVRLPKKLTKSTEETSFVATALYRVALETNIEIIERHAHLDLPEYAEAGFDAQVGIPKFGSASGFKDDDAEARVETEEESADKATNENDDEDLEEANDEETSHNLDEEDEMTLFDPKQKNLVLRNPNDYNYIIKAKYENKELVMSLERIEQPDANVFKPVVRNEEKLKSRTVERYSPKILTKESYEIEPGAEGIRIEVYREELSPKGDLIAEEFLNRNFYPPKPKVVLVSTMTAEEIDAREEAEREKEKEKALEDDRLDASSLEKRVEAELESIEDTTEIDSVLTNEVYESILIKMMQDYIENELDGELP